MSSAPMITHSRRADAERRRQRAAEQCLRLIPPIILASRISRTIQ